MKIKIFNNNKLYKKIILVIRNLIYLIMIKFYREIRIHQFIQIKINLKKIKKTSYFQNNN